MTDAESILPKEMVEKAIEAFIGSPIPRGYEYLHDETLRRVAPILVAAGVPALLARIKELESELDIALRHREFSRKLAEYHRNQNTALMDWALIFWAWLQKHDLEDRVGFGAWFLDAGFAQSLEKILLNPEPNKEPK